MPDDPANRKAAISHILSTAQRKRMPTKEFAGPDRSYPIPDRTHAANAKARAKQMLDAGKLDRQTYAKIVSKANSVLNKH